jgi:hypothetical protein
MRLVRKAEALRPRTYFVHVPKTAGITLKAFLESNYAHGESLVVDEWKARELPAEEIRRYRLLSGHYSSEVLDAIGERPDVTIMLVREPIARFRSWIAHTRRLTDRRYRDLCEGRTDRELFEGPAGYAGYQAHWVARALREGANYQGVPDAAELPALVAQVDIVGLSEEMERCMQLVSFQMGWPPPPNGWRINRRPDADAESPDISSDLPDHELAARLAVDRLLYGIVRQRFWTAYARMLTTIAPHETSFNADSAVDVPVETAQEWLRACTTRQIRETHATAAERIDYSGDEPVTGEGWWWRERPKELGYRWSGPGDSATMMLPPLVPGQSYAITVDLMGACDWSAWEAAGLSVNDVQLDVVRERIAPRERGDVALRLHAVIPLRIVAAQDQATKLTFHCHTRQALSHVNVLESFDTYNHDMRRVGLAVHSVRIRKAATLAPPVLSLSRPGNVAA